METKALLEFVLFHGTLDTWPMFTNSSRFWRETTRICEAKDWWLKYMDRQTKGSLFILNLQLVAVHLKHHFAAGACQLMATRVLARQFQSPAHADQHFFGREQVEETEVVQPATSDAG